MYACGIDPKCLGTENDIDIAKKFMDVTFNIYGNREIIVIDEHTKRIAGCLTRQDLDKVIEKDIFYLRKAREYFQKIQTVRKSDLSLENLLDAAYEHGSMFRFRSLFVIRDTSYPKKMSYTDIIAEIPEKIIMKLLTVKDHTSQNCPHEYHFKVKE